MDLDKLILTVAAAVDQGEPDAALQERVWAHLLAQADAPGDLYQHLKSRVLLRQDAGEVTVRHERARHRATGVYYTHSSVTAYMARRARELAPHAVDILDPACGDGAFLEAASRFFSDCVRLTGADRDPAAVALAQRRLGHLAPRLLAADSLLDDLRGPYELVLGNPPYISHGLRGAPGADAAWMQRLKARYPASAQYKLNTYPLFVERGLELLRPGGVLGFVLPDSFLAGRYFEGLRRLLLQHTIAEITLIRQDFWQHGRVGQTVLLFVRKAPPAVGHMVSSRVCQTIADLDTVSVTPVYQSDLSWGQASRFCLVTDPLEQQLVREMTAVPGVSPLGSLVRTYSGLIARQGQHSLLRSTNPDRPGPWAPLLRSGREIDRYSLRWAGEQVCLDQVLFKSGARFEYYRQPKILLRQTADSLRAVLDTGGYFCLNNIHLLIPRSPDLPLAALEAVLNASPLNRHYRALALEAGRLYAQVDLDMLSELPVPPLAPVAHRLSLLVAQRKSAAPQGAARMDAEIDAIVARAYGLTAYR